MLFVQAPRVVRAILGATLSVLAAAVVAQSSSTTVTIVDTEGRTVEVPAQPERVLLGFYFEDFYAIVGDTAFDRVVAISRATWADWRASQWDAYVAVAPRIADLVDVGEVEAGTFNIEAALAARPDVAIFAKWQYTALGDAIDKMEAAGIPVVVADFNAQTVEMHEASALLIGKLMNTEDRARRLVDEYKTAVADVVARVASAGGQNKPVYVELGNKGPDTVGNSYGVGMWGGVIEMAGGDNIAAGKVEAWGPLSPEYVLSRNPEIVILAGSAWRNRPTAVLMGFGVKGETTRSRMRPYTARPGWASLDAVRNGEVHAVYHGGTRTLYDYTFLQYIAKQLHPQAFADVDPEANHRRFYEQYLPVDADGVFMLGLGK